MQTVLISQQTSKLDATQPFIEANNIMHLADEQSEPDHDAGQAADFAIVDGAEILQQDAREHRVMITALESGIPMIMVNATPDATQIAAGASVDADMVLIQSEPGQAAMQVRAIQPESTSTATSAASAADDDDEDTIAPRVEVSTLQAEEANAASMLDLDRSIRGILPDRQDLPHGSYFSRYFSADSPPGRLFNPGSSVNLGYLVEVIASDDPPRKTVIVSTVGTGFSLGDPRRNHTGDRGYYLEHAQITIHPMAFPPGSYLSEIHPANENSVTTITQIRKSSESTTVGISGSTPSASQTKTEEKEDAPTLSLPTYRTLSQARGNTVVVDYKLARTGDGYPYNNAFDLAEAWDKPLRPLPPMAMNNLPIQIQAVWHLPADTRKMIGIRFTERALLVRAHKNRSLQGAGDVLGFFDQLGFTDRYTEFLPNWVGMSVYSMEYRNRQTAMLFPGMVSVQPKPKPKPQPQFLTSVRNTEGLDDLVFFTPENNRISYLKATGDGSYEGVYTVIDFENMQLYEPPKEPPQPVYIAQHTVRPGESLSVIAFKYYQSAVRNKWIIIYNANRHTIGDEPALITPGQTLKIPAWGGAHLPWEVRGGDTLETIGEQWGVEPATIAEFNQLQLPSTLSPGQTILIPQGFG